MGVESLVVLLGGAEAGDLREIEEGGGGGGLTWLCDGGGAVVWW